MEVSFLNKDEIKKEITGKLKNGWCVIQGDINTVSEIEENVYTPGTEKNCDFEILGFNPSIVFGKKTKELKELLRNPPDFNNILILSFRRIDDKQIKADLMVAKTENLQVSISEIAEDFGQQLTHDTMFNREK